MDDLIQSSILKKTLMLEVMSRRVDPRVTVIVAAVAAVAYYCVCALFLLVAFIDLIREIITFKRKKESRHICSRFSDTLLIALLCLLPVLGFLLVQACDMGVGGVWSKYTGEGVGLAWGGVLTVAITLIGALFVISKNTISLVSRREKYFGESRINNLICCALALVVMVSVCMPCVTLKLSDAKGEDTAFVSVDFDELREQSLDDVYQIGKTSSERGRTQLKIRINDTLDDILFHEEGSCKQILDTLFININRMDTGMIYIAISLITAALLWVAGILLFALLTKIFQSAKTGLIIKIFKIIVYFVDVFTFIRHIVVLCADEQSFVFH